MRFNCQAVYDVYAPLLDISITHRGASPDVMAFERSVLKKDARRGLLDDKLLLYGDNTYFNIMTWKLHILIHLADQKIVTTTFTLSSGLGLSVHLTN